MTLITLIVLSWLLVGGVAYVAFLLVTAYPVWTVCACAVAIVVLLLIRVEVIDDTAA